MTISPDQFLDYLFGRATPEVRGRITEALSGSKTKVSTLVLRIVEAIQEVHGHSNPHTDLAPSQIVLHRSIVPDSRQTIFADFLAARRGVADEQQLSRVNAGLASQHSELRQALQGVQKLLEDAFSGGSHNERTDFWDRRRRWLLEHPEESVESPDAPDASTQPITPPREGATPIAASSVAHTPETLAQREKLYNAIERFIDTAEALGRSSVQRDPERTVSPHGGSEQDLKSDPYSTSSGHVPTATDELLIAAVTFGLALAQGLEEPTPDHGHQSKLPPN
jgi:O-acetyl-ADP-ribose deacetylase (regulator of RNase III)